MKSSKRQVMCYGTSLFSPAYRPQCRRVKIRKKNLTQSPLLGAGYVAFYERSLHYLHQEPMRDWVGSSTGLHPTLKSSIVLSIYLLCIKLIFLRAPFRFARLFTFLLFFNRSLFMDDHCLCRVNW